MFTMIVCYCIGLVLGAVAQHSIQKHIEQHKRDRPIPGEPHAVDVDEASISGQGGAPQVSA